MEPIKYFHVVVEPGYSQEFINVIDMDITHATYYERQDTREFWLGLTDRVRAAINEVLEARKVQLVSTKTITEDEFYTTISAADIVSHTGW